ncbi:MAG: DUF4349 domain-containing protein, partial [Bacteroidia bacterium]|nr:DUF4349 domain-containing protein [Bacteroidia bacterium]
TIQPPLRKKPAPDLSANLNLNQSGRQFVRSVETRFRVHNTRQATRQIEDISAHYEGFITYTDMRSRIVRVDRVPISADSTEERTFFTIDNEMTLRVPNHNLDSVLRALNPLIEFLDYRTLKADDVSLQMLGNTWKAKRQAGAEERLAKAINAQNTAKLNEVVEAEDRLLDRQNQADHQNLEQLRLADEVAYSTLKIYLYQPEVMHTTCVAHFTPTRVSFVNKLGESLWQSVYALEALFLALVQVWYLLLVLGLGIYAYRRYLGKEKV